MAWSAPRASAVGIAVAATATFAVGAVAARLVTDGPRQEDDVTGPAVARLVPARAAPVVPASFLGLSIEWDSVLPYTGPAGHRRRDLLRVLAPVARAAGTPPPLALGGDRGDQAWWNPARRPRPPTVLQDVGPATIGAVAWLARA